jgi:anaerobic ribonucleoside-triphosphate reductase
MAQNIQIDKNKYNQGQKSHDHFNNFRKAFNKIQHPFIIKAPKERGIEETPQSIIEVTYFSRQVFYYLSHSTSPTNIFLNGKKTETIFFKFWNETRMPTLSTLTVFKCFAQSIRQDK